MAEDTASHEGEWWVRQGSEVVVEDCIPETQAALVDLGHWFFGKTGRKLVCTAGTNGSHAGGEHSHAAGWKLDVNDWYGPEGLDGTYFGYPLDSNGTQLLSDFVDYGHSLGLGMAIEGDHVDIQIDGREWTTGEEYGGYRNPNGNKTRIGAGGRGAAPAGGAYMAGLKDTGHSLEATPAKKTYAEPMYPDYIYVAGNIPTAAVEKTVVNRTGSMEQADGYAMMTALTMQDITGMDMHAFTTTQAQDLAQRPFDPLKAELEVKVPNAGKPLNNNDPYPVDLKIEELERHLPRVKQYKVAYNRKVGETKEIAAAVIHASDYAEKRIVKLENTVATLMRYIFAMGSRVAVNCVYFGGQDHRSKYKTIRCLKDNRTDDGQVMQIDQCLSCSRFEPMIGQTYDILGATGANLSNIHDDCQAGYMNMGDMIDFLRVEKMHEKKKPYQLDYEHVDRKDPNDRDFKDIWDEGVKMDWKLTPVEQQKPQINWRQDINSEDKSPDKLDSYQSSPAQTGDNPGSTMAAGNYKDWVTKHKDDLEKKLKAELPAARTDEDGKTTNADEIEHIRILKECIQKGFGQGSYAAKKALENMNNAGYEQALQNASKDAGIDPVALLAVASVLTEGNPNAGKGMFGLGAGEVKDQCKAAAEKLKGDIPTAGRGDNPIGPIQAFREWNDSLKAVNRDENVMYSYEWIEAAGREEPARIFFPAFVQSYMDIASSGAGLSQLRSGATGVEFPLATVDLTNAYYIQKFGASVIGTGVAAVSNACVMRVPGGTAVHAPADGAVSAMQYDDRIGSYIRITATDGTTYILGGLSGAGKEDGGKGAVVGYSSEKLILQVKAGGKYLDPETTWPGLSGKLSEEASIGAQIADENQKNASDG